jgi:hypothetical protein
MNQKKINRILEIFRSHLNEEPTMALSHGQIAGTKESGDEPPVDLRKGKMRTWNPFFKNLVKMYRRKK